MNILRINMHHDDLKMMWVCNKCRSRFVFHSDVDEHRKKTEHLTIEKYDLKSGKLVDSLGAIYGTSMR